MGQQAREVGSLEYKEKALIRLIMKANQRKKQRLIAGIIGEALGLFKQAIMIDNM